MNWLDIVLMVVLGVATFVGFKMGLIGAAITAVGVLIGWLIAGQFADDLGGMFSSTIKNDTLVTTIAYSLIMTAAVVIAGIVAKIVKPLLKVFTVGLSSLVDKLGGLALGLVVGGVVVGALIIASARLTYDYESYDILASVPAQFQGSPQLAQLEGQVARIDSVKAGLEEILTGSRFVSIFVDVTAALPANALGFVPADFKASLEILESNIEK